MTAPDWNLLLAALLASLPVLLTPGPNNIICAAIGANYGYRRALPYALGTTLGFPLLLCGVGWGLGTLIKLYPQIHFTAKITGALFLVYLAYCTATAPMKGLANAPLKKIQGFWYAMVFQWINPKGVSYALSLIALYARPQALATDVPLLMLMAALLTLPITMTWAIAGNMLGQFLHNPLHHRVFNTVMAALLVFAAVGILFY